MRTQALSAALVLAMGLAVAGVAQTWSPFTSKEGNFTILFPGTPKPEQKTITSTVGPVLMNLFTVDKGATAYIVNYIDYPADRVAQADPKKILAEAVAGQLKTLKAKASVDKQITVDGNPGRDVIFAGAKNFSGRCKLLLVKNRLYAALALTQNNAAPASDFAKYVDSFALLK
jgi:hypothetical protein